MRIIGWNCRGVGGPRAIRSICDVVRTHRPSIFGLIETKKNDGNWDPIRCRLGFKGCVAVDSRGKSGGLALMWTDEVELELLSFSHSHIDVAVKGEVKFFFTLFYGSPRVLERMASWELLKKLRKDPHSPWVVLGDFNEVAYSWEVESKRARQQWQMRNFRQCLEECGLSEIRFKGDPYTYSNRRKGEQEVKA
ncbi:hypothetical protein QQ045_007786 [Rhodiola kirilowii]